MKSKICEMIGIQYPIIQGGMAWVANPSLASAVSNAGGLGILACGHAPGSTVLEWINEMKQLTDKPFGVNIMLLNPNVDEVVDVVCSSGVKVVCTGAGSPSKFMKKFQEAGIVVIPVVASVALAKRMEKEGAHAVVVEGMEAGGHIGKLTTMALLPQVVDSVNIPVIAAGGIGDGRGMAAAIMLGADAVQLGTRFLVAHESTAHANFKAAIIKSKDIDTVITGQITGHPVRVLRNKLTKLYLEAEKEETGKKEPNFERLEEIGRGALKRVVVDGDIQMGSMMAGQISGLVSKEQSCQEIILELMEESQHVIQEQMARF